MEQDTPRQRLSQISTLWSMLLEVHEGSPDGARAACDALLARYGGAVYRYLLGALHDAEAADDLSQEFALRFVRGDFRRADAQRGRFRDYLKTALAHLIADFHRRRQAWHQPLSPEAPEPPAPAETSAASDAVFLASWRDELLESTWKALERASPACHAVLRLRIEQPDLTSTQVAEQIAAQTGEPRTAAWARKTLQRAHDKFADLLLEEVAQTLPAATPEALRQELRDLDLLKYCAGALERWDK
jgi:RNA polymerase sigma-70 factor (ECF subfamily)